MPKLAPLAELKTLNGVSYVYDPDQVVALANANQILPNGNLGKLVVHVCGVAATGLPIEGTAGAFLDALKVQHEFIKLTGKNGDIVVRAKAVSFILSHEPGIPDPAIRSTVHFAVDQLLHFYAYEDVATIKRLIDEIRLSADGD